MNKNLVKQFIKYISLILYIFLISFNFYQSVQTSQVSSNMSSSFTDFIVENFPPVNHIAQKTQDFPTLVRKFFGHYGIFTLIGFFGTIFYLLTFSKPKIFSIITIISGIIVSITSEILQYFSVGRSSEFTDMLLDFNGFLTGVFIVLSALVFIKSSKYFISNIITICTAFLSVLAFILFSKKYESINICFYLYLFFLALFLLVYLLKFIIYKLKNKQNSTT